MKLVKDKIRSFLSGIVANLHYFGFVVVGLLIFQAYQTSKVSETTLKDSIQQQEALRSILWVNLLTQRATVLVLSPMVTKDSNSYEQASRIAGALPEFLKNKSEESSANQIELKSRVNSVFDQIKAINPSQLDLVAQQHLLSDVNKLGTDLNARESKQWFDLLAKNTRLLKDFENRRMENNVGYVLFTFYLVFMGWISIKKKKTELLLIQSERKGRVLTEASFEGLVILDKKKIVEVNPAFETLFEIPSAKVVGRSIDDFIEFTDKDVSLENALANIKKNIDVIGKRSRSGEIPIEISVKEFIFEDRLIKIIAIRDLSERKRSEGFKLEKEAAEKANHAKSIFLANMSHELRTPMHGILSFARFGQQKIETAPKEKLKSYFDEIYDSGSRLMSLLNDLLDLSKLEAGKISYTMQESNMVESVKSVITEMSAFAHEKGLRLRATYIVPEILGMFDSERIGQVLRNLLSNAIKFSEKGTTVTLELNHTEEKINCSVINQGIGIPESELESIFDKFVQSSKTKTGAGGTGLGLAISKEIVQHHGGKIWAESKSNGETKFNFELPKKITNRIQQVA